MFTNNNEVYIQHERPPKERRYRVIRCGHDPHVRDYVYPRA